MNARAAGFVGVDVVDTHDPRCLGKERDGRFLARILAPEEQRSVEASPDPAPLLWRLWAAKEAAFKVVSKLRGAPPPFTHATFLVDPVAAAPREGDLPGRVRWEELTLHVRWEEGDGRVGALAWDGLPDPGPIHWAWGAADALDPAPAASLETLTEGLTARERMAVHSRGSALVRLEARVALAAELGVEPGRIEIVCGDGPRGRTPPLALLDGRPAPADVSLSHHGRWLAWAVRGSRPG